MKNVSNSVENNSNGQPGIFENVISIEKLEERLETMETCEGIMAF